MLVVSGSGAQVRDQTGSPNQVLQPAGENFTVHTSVDPNYCFTDIPQDGRPSSLAQCIVNDEMRFTFAQATDNSSVVVDGSGQCLQAGKKPNVDAEFTPCTFSTAERFLYTAKGQVKTESGNLCLQDAQAAQNAAVFFAPCAKGVTTQIWQLGH